MTDQFVEYTEILWDKFMRGKIDEDRYITLDSKLAEWEAEALRKESENAA